MSNLRPCSACARHIRDERCPFCNAVEPRAPEVNPARARLRRAAVMALGGAMFVACSEDATTSTDAGADTGVTTGDAATDTAVVDTRPPDDPIAMPYGAPPTDGLLV